MIFSEWFRVKWGHEHDVAREPLALVTMKWSCLWLPCLEASFSLPRTQTGPCYILNQDNWPAQSVWSWCWNRSWSLTSAALTVSADSMGLCGGLIWQYMGPFPAHDEHRLHFTLEIKHCGLDTGCVCVRVWMHACAHKRAFWRNLASVSGLLRPSLLPDWLNSLYPNLNTVLVCLMSFILSSRSHMTVCLFLSYVACICIRPTCPSSRWKMVSE